MLLHHKVKEVEERVSAHDTILSIHTKILSRHEEMMSSITGKLDAILFGLADITKLMRELVGKLK